MSESDEAGTLYDLAAAAHFIALGVQAEVSGRRSALVADLERLAASDLEHRVADRDVRSTRCGCVEGEAGKSAAASVSVRLDVDDLLAKVSVREVLSLLLRHLISPSVGEGGNPSSPIVGAADGADPSAAPSAPRTPQSLTEDLLSDWDGPLA